MRLWTYWRSSSAYRVRIALGLKQQAVDYVHVHLLREGGQQHQPGFLDVNPLRQVPVLEVEEAGEPRLLVQSMAIIAYLDERFPDPPLLPASAADRAHVRAMAEVVNSGIQPLQNTNTFRELTALGIAPEPWAKAFVAQGLAALELLARPRAGAFLFGDRVSLADLYLVPQLYNARRYGVALEALPTLLRAEASAQALPAFQAARPEAQADAEPVFGSFAPAPLK
jgi:maleylpyruvate isomerase